MRKQLLLALLGALLALPALAPQSNATVAPRTVVFNGVEYQCDGFETKDQLTLETHRFHADFTAWYDSPETNRELGQADRLELWNICDIMSFHARDQMACDPDKYAGADQWVYKVLGQRDPPLQGSFYLATWTGSRTYTYDPGLGHCRITSVHCHITISDGDVWKYDAGYITGGGGWVTVSSGTYHGLAATRVSADCSNSYASAGGSVALVIPVSGGTI